MRRHGMEVSHIYHPLDCWLAGMLLVGRLAEQAAGKLLYYDYAKQSPVMLEMFRCYIFRPLQVSLLI